jgi:hypothetical protein
MHQLDPRGCHLFDSRSKEMLAVQRVEMDVICFGSLDQAEVDEAVENLLRAGAGAAAGTRKRSPALQTPSASQCHQNVPIDAWADGIEGFREIH